MCDDNLESHPVMYEYTDVTILLKCMSPIEVSELFLILSTQCIGMFYHIFRKAVFQKYLKIISEFFPHKKKPSTKLKLSVVLE